MVIFLWAEILIDFISDFYWGKQQHVYDKCWQQKVIMCQIVLSCYLLNNNENQHEMYIDENKQQIIPNFLYETVVSSFSKA